jgi:hypothetical protein
MCRLGGRFKTSTDGERGGDHHGFPVGLRCRGTRHPLSTDVPIEGHLETVGVVISYLKGGAGIDGFGTVRAGYNKMEPCEETLSDRCRIRTDSYVKHEAMSPSAARVRVEGKPPAGWIGCTSDRTGQCATSDGPRERRLT